MQVNELYNGDCFDIMPMIPDHSIDMIMTDLPYGITTCKWDTPLDLDRLWKEYKRMLVKGGAVILSATQPFAARLIMSNPKWFRHEVIWEKDNGSNCFNVNRMPFQVHENILVFCERGTIYNPQMTDGKAYGRIQKGSRYQHLGPTERITTTNHGNRYPRSVQKFKRDYGKLIHPTQKPVALYEWIIKTYSNENALILDNCAGSGTTAIAARNYNRRWILIEKDKEIYERARERIYKE